MKGIIIIIALVVYLVHVVCVFASTRVKKRRAMRDREMINRYLVERDKCS